MAKKNSYDELRQLKGKYLNYFLAGFVDGEGSFNVSFARHPGLKSKWIITARFQVYQHTNHAEILQIFQETFKTGRIHPKSGSNVMVFTIDSKRSLEEKVIPFFQKYSLGTKASVFEQWVTIVQMLNRKEHLTKTGFEKIVRIATEMNKVGKGRKYSKEFLMNTYGLEEPSETTRLTLPN